MEFALDLTRRQGRACCGALRMLLDDLADSNGGGRNATADRHVEAVVLDRLLLAQHHKYSEILHRPSQSRPGRVVRRVMELMEERPGEPWTIVSLVSEVHVSVRSLHQLFHDEIGTPPMAYLRGVRLRWVRETLEHSTSGDVTVRFVATRAGFLHQGRFAALYRDAFGESPSETLRRPRDD